MSSMDARRYALAGAVAVSAALGAGLLVLDAAGVHTPGLVQDPAAVGEVVPWTGFFSTLGVMIWAAAAGICLLTAAVLLHAREQAAWFFLATAALLAFLALDDAYLFHDEIAPEWLGVSERGVYALVLMAVFAWVVRFRQEIAASDRRLLAVAAVAFGGSLIVDSMNETGLIVLEDWFKLSGIVAVAIWCFMEAVAVLSRGASRGARQGASSPAPSDHVPFPAHRPVRGQREHVHERRPS